MRKFSYLPWVVVAVLVLVMSTLAFRYLIQEEPRQSDGAGADPQQIRIGYLAIAASLPLFVAVEEELLEQAGFEPILTKFNSSNELALAGVTGQLDVLVTCATNAAFDAIETAKKPLVAFLANGYVKGNDERRSTDYLLGAPGITIDGLQGKPIAFFPGSVSKVFADIVLPRYGLSRKDFEYIEMPPPQWLPALESGKIAAVNAVEPAASLILQSNAGHILIDGFFAEAQPSVPLSASWFAGTRLGERDRAKLVTVFENSLKLINEDRNLATRHYENYTSIPNSIYETIGLNEWGLTTNQEVRKNFHNFASLLEDNNSVKSIPEAGDWLWMPQP